METKHGFRGGLRLATICASIVALPETTQAGGAATPRDVTVAFSVHMKDALAATAVSNTLVGAFRRLEEPRCQQIFSDFSDASGRPLRQALEDVGQTGQGYLRLVTFDDGRDVPQCSRRCFLALTSPGSRVVHVCRNQFVDIARHDPTFAEATLIHELLHSLGLGENPPSSLEITHTVLRQCGP